MNLFPQEHCLFCHEIINQTIGWRAIFSTEKAQLICQTCEGKLEKIEGETCRICSRPFRLLDEKFRDGDLCHDCYRWEEDSEWREFLDKNHSIFLYNDYIKEIIAKYKFRGDYILVRYFAHFFQKMLEQLDQGLLVPIPLSEERLYERGFNQAEALIVESGKVPAKILTRIHAEKQSKKSRLERIHLSQVFKLAPNTNLEGQEIILVDDIYTTGSTLRHAAKLLKQAGALTIQSLTIAR